MILDRLNSAGFASRLGTGLAMAAILLIVWHTGGWAIFGLIAVITAIALWELFAMFLPWESKTSKGGACALGVLFLLAYHSFPQLPMQSSLLGLALLLAVVSLWRWNKVDSTRYFLRSIIVFSGIVYIAACLAPALRISRMEQILVVAVPVLSDMAAYFIGISFGQHKIWPAVSPKKSVEGAAAGLLAAMLTCCVFGLAFGTASAGSFLLLGLVLGIMSQLGDFFESALKRSVDIKDSGNILPGHGGMLDRIDSILFSCATYSIISSVVPFFA